MEVCRKNLDWFLHTCSDCDVSFEALFHHIDFTDKDDVWSVFMLSDTENLGSFSV